jgi:hypothetical protein
MFISLVASVVSLVSTARGQCGTGSPEKVFPSRGVVDAVIAAMYASLRATLEGPAVCRMLELHTDSACAD